AAEVGALLEQHLAHLKQPSLVTRPGTVEAPSQQKSGRRAALVGIAVLGILGAMLSYPYWRPAGQGPMAPGPSGPGGGGSARGAVSGQTEGTASQNLRSLVLQGPGATRDALIDFDEPDRCYSTAAYENAVRRADQCNAFLVRFDLAKLALPPSSRIAAAT